MDKPESPLAFDIDREQREPQECCDRIKEKFSVDPNEREFRPRAPLADRQPRNLIEDLVR